MPAARIQQAADCLLRAERGAALADLPAALVPTSAAEAYAIQEAALGSDPIAAWKVAAIQVPGALTYAAIGHRRMLADRCPPHLAQPEIEVEIALEIARDLPARPQPYSEPEVRAALGQAHAAFEVIGSRFVNRKAVAPLSALADALSCSGVVIGSGCDDWEGLDFTELEVRLEGDAPMARTSGNATVAQTLTALTALANHASARGMGLRAGQCVITGARIGPLPLSRGQRVTATVERIGSVSLEV